MIIRFWRKKSDFSVYFFTLMKYVVTISDKFCGYLNSLVKV